MSPWAARVLPSRAGVLASYFGCRALAGIVLALPLSTTVAAQVGHHPRGDAVLWDAGGLVLMDTLMRREDALAAAGLTSLLLVVLVVFALLVPLGALLAALDSVSGARRLLARAVERFGTLALLLGITSLAQAAVLVTATLAGMVLAAAIELGPEREDQIQLVTLGGGVVLGWLLGVVQDLARVAAVQHDRGVLDAAGVAIEAARRSLGAVVAAAGWRSAAALAVLLVAGWLAVVLGCQMWWRLALVVAIHHAALLAVVGLRASWLRWASRRLGLLLRPGFEASSSQAGSD